MKALVLIFSIYLVIFSGLIAIVMVINRSFVIVLSVLVLPATAYFISRYYYLKKGSKEIVIIFLSLTVLIFICYTYNTLNKISNVTLFIFVPVTGLIISGIILINLIMQHKRKLNKA